MTFRQRYFVVARPALTSTSASSSASVSAPVGQGRLRDALGSHPHSPSQLRDAIRQQCSGYLEKERELFNAYLALAQGQVTQGAEAAQVGRAARLRVWLRA